MIGIEPPRVDRPYESADRPHCGRCGVEYRFSGHSPAEYDARVRLNHYVPQCPCWRAAYEDSR